MKYIVYLTVNVKNEKIYVGVHKTENPDIFDGYLGCGVNKFQPYTYKHSKTAFQYAVNKYGIDAFKRTTLAIFDNKEDAFLLESKIVTEEFIKRKNVYNMIVGGFHGPDQSVIIYQYNLDGTFVKAWPSYKEAANFFNCTATSIENAVCFKNSSRGFLWTNIYTPNLNINEFSYKEKIDCIYCYDEDGNFIKTYENTTEIIEELGVSRVVINRAIQGQYKTKNKYFSKTKVDKFVPNQIKVDKNTEIFLYNLDGNYVTSYESPSICAKALGLNKTNSIYNAIRLGRTCCGYQFSTEKLDNMKSLQRANLQLRIDQFDLNGNYIKTFNSLSEARKEFGTGVVKVIRGQQKQCKNFIFKIRS